MLLTLAQPRAISSRLVQGIAVCALALACGFGWAAWRANERMADELPAAWEGRDIVIVGVAAALPQPYQRSVRFDFDVEQVLTSDAQVPSHIALSWWNSARDEKRRNCRNCTPENAGGSRCACAGRTAR